MRGQKEKCKKENQCSRQKEPSTGLYQQQRNW